MSRTELLKERIKDLEFVFRRYFRVLPVIELNQIDIDLMMMEAELDMIDREQRA